jgi:hypothetical protein
MSVDAILKEVEASLKAEADDRHMSLWHQKIM